ncbi:hypothetical protein ABT330_02850 [Streptomyces sp. NPDC000658]|uniref:hypothetical protein n=1 Tax=Streptomyces sp. NPDC000658 TaxID=3154266 RepID=UPI0033240180
MTGTHEDTTRRRALAVTGGTLTAGTLAVAGYQSAFADTQSSAATAAASATASATSAGGTCVTLMSSVTEGHSGSYTRLDDDMVHDGDGGGASSGLLTLNAVHRADPSKGYKGYKGSLVLGVDPDAGNTGAGGGGGTPPSGAPGDAPAGTPPSAAPTASVSSAPTASS